MTSKTTTGNAAYEVWLTFNDGTEKIQFPVNPDELTTDTGDGVETVDIVGLGEILKHKDRRAKRISFSSFLPANTFPGIKFDYIWNPYTIKAKLQDWKDNDRVLLFVITDSFIWFRCKINKLVWTERGGDVGTMYFDIELVEYRQPTIRKITVEDGTGYLGNEERYDDRVAPDTYTVKNGDCLWAIAQSQLGNGSRWKEIYDINQDVLKGSQIIHTGDVLKLPKK